MSDYQSDITSSTTEDAAVDILTRTVEELAERHHADCYEAPTCSACVIETPISGVWGPWMDKRDEFHAIVGVAIQQIASLDGNTESILPFARGRYDDAFERAGVPPSECRVCQHNVDTDTHGDAPRCGHERAEGRGACPVWT